MQEDQEKNKEEVVSSVVTTTTDPPAGAGGRRQFLPRLVCQYLKQVESSTVPQNKAEAAFIIATTDQLLHLVQGLKPPMEIVPSDQYLAKDLELVLIQLLERCVAYSVTKVDLTPYYRHYLVILSMIRALIETKHEVVAPPPPQGEGEEEEEIPPLEAGPFGSTEQEKEK
jgi:hypothetical protein